MSRPIADVLASLVAAVEHYQRIGALTLDEHQAATLGQLLDEASAVAREAEPWAYLDEGKAAVRAQPATPFPSGGTERDYQAWLLANGLVTPE